MLLSRLSNHIAKHLCNNLKIDLEQIPVYAYGLELLLAAVINIVLMALVSSILQVWFAWIIFLAAFIPLRVTAGGYHAHTHLTCTIVCLIAFALAVLTDRLVPAQTKPVLCFTFALINLATVLWFSPVEAIQKPLNTDERKENRMRSLCISVCYALFAALAVFRPFTTVVHLFCLGVFTASISQVAGKIQTTKERGRIHG